MAREQQHINFNGTVQGVGFRYTACRIATRYDVSGYVRNLPDGRVECVVEGEDSEIDAFIGDLAQAMSGHIRNKAQQTAAYTGEFDSFAIRF